MSDIIALKDLCEIEITDGTHKTPTYSESGYIFLSSKNVTTGEIDWDNVMYIPDWLHNELYSRISPQKDDILLAKNGTTGVAAIVDRDEIFDIYVSLALIRPKKTKILPRYLLHAINSESSKRYFDGHLKGIGVPNLHLTHIRETPIKVPDLKKQISVVNELDKVMNLINKRKEQLSKLDELVKARFVELFGTPLLNEKGWEVKNTGDVCSVTDGSHFSPVGKEDGYPMLSVRNMRNDGFHYDDCKLVSQEDYDVLVKQGCKPLKNDVLIAKDGSYFYYGFVVKEEIEQAVLSSIAILRPNLEQVNPEYLCRYMLSSEIVDLVGKNYVTGAAIKRVILKGIKQIPVMLPPIELQNQFAIFIKQTDKSKLEVEKSLEKLELLKKALMQKYFG